MKRKFIFLMSLVTICMLIFSGAAFANNKTGDVMAQPQIKIIDIQAVDYNSLPDNVKKTVDEQKAQANRYRQKLNEKGVTPAATYFASAKINCPDTFPLDQNVNIYVTTSSYPGGLWQFEAVDLNGTWGVIPVSPSYTAYNSRGALWSWGSAPFETKTVRVVCQFVHSGDYKLHVWGGAGVLSHADDVKTVRAQ